MEEHTWPSPLGLIFSSPTRSETGNMGTLTSPHDVHTLDTAHSSLYQPYSKQGNGLKDSYAMAVSSHQGLPGSESLPFSF